MPEPMLSSTPAIARRLWLFRLAALFLVPLLFFALVEGGLRLAGYGYDTSFFLKRTIDGRERLVENPRYGFRFFPPGAARSPTPVVMPVKKAPGTVRIFIFGESAALGDPKPAFGMGRYIEILLGDRYPDKKFEVVCVAMTAINSHVVLQIARECASHEGDLWVIFMGNNEMIGPFGGATEGKNVPSIGTVRISLALEKLRVGQLMEAALRRIRGGEAQAWRGLGQFGDRQVAPDDPVRGKVDENFRRNLRDILTVSEKAGAKALVSEVGANLADWAPHASMHSLSASRSQIDQWKKEFAAAISEAATNGPGAALPAFERAAGIDPGFAEEHYRAGVCQLQVSNLAGAKREFQLALDCDALPFRTTSARNEIIRSVGKEFSNARVVNLPETFAENSASKIPGREMFVDHVHFTYAGAYVAGRALSVEIEQALGFPANNSKAWLSETAVEAELGLTPWNRYLAAENILTRLSDAVYTNQLTNLKTRRELREQMNEYRRLAREDKEAERVYKNAIDKKPRDFYLIQNYAEYLELKGNVAGAAEKWRDVTHLLPHHPVAYFHCGRLDHKLGKLDEAAKELSVALRIRPDFNEAVVELGQVYRKQGKKAEAIETLRRAVMQNPNNPAAHFYLADALAFSNQKQDALRELMAAIRLRPSYWEARYFLGVERAMRGELVAAEEQFREVVRLRPEFALGYLNLGVAQAKQAKLREAIQSFERTLELDPSNSVARQQLETAKALLNPSHSLPVTVP